MTIHEALLVLATCDTEKDDCKECPLYASSPFMAPDGHTYLWSPCSMLESLKLVLSHRPFPLKVEAPHAQG